MEYTKWMYFVLPFLKDTLPTLSKSMANWRYQMYMISFQSKYCLVIQSIWSISVSFSSVRIKLAQCDGILCFQIQTLFSYYDRSVWLFQLWVPRVVLDIKDVWTRATSRKFKMVIHSQKNQWEVFELQALGWCWTRDLSICLVSSEPAN